MGWLFQHKDKQIKPADYLAQDALRWTLPAGQQPSEVARCVRSGVIYFAIRFPAPYVANHAMLDTFVPEPDGSVVTALVFLVKGARDWHNFGYKDMDETMGPCESTASKAFIAKLSKLREPRAGAPEGGLHWAREWRARCIANAEAGAQHSAQRRRIKPGTVVRLSQPLTFADGAELAEFTAVVIPRWRRGKRSDTLSFRSAQTGGLYRISARHLATAEIAAQP